MKTEAHGRLVNDIHSRLNETRVTRLIEPAGRDALVRTVQAAQANGAQLSVCGSRHAMGGQQFAANTWLVDMRAHACVRDFDEDRGLITVDAGMQWPVLIAACHVRARPGRPPWSIRQKQTGADRLTIGGALAANIHGRGLRMAPIVADVERFTLIDAHGEIRRCSRTEHSGLFRLAIGGYGLFGLIADVTLRLAPRVKLERRVRVVALEEAMCALETCDPDHWLYGDFQYCTDERSPDFLRRGVFSVYQRVSDHACIPQAQRHLGSADWVRLLHLAHTDRGRAFREYAAYYLSTSGQRYWSDTHQLSLYIDGYHDALDRRLGAQHCGSEMITEIFVPRGSLVAFMQRAAEFLRDTGVPVIYGTVRLIERDTESFLAWAREPWACVIFNLHVDHTSAGVALARTAFRGLIDLAIRFGGSYYLTYHRWARRDQVEACHPRMRGFIELKRAHDPSEIFTSDWYRHHRDLFRAAAAEPPVPRPGRLDETAAVPARTCTAT